jgi:DNA-binding MarR family transcriptional regulator
MGEGAAESNSSTQGCDEGRIVSALAWLANTTRREFSARIRDESWALEAGLRRGSYGILQVVRARQPISQREVSDRIAMDPADVVAIIDLLERAGFITRARDAGDRRRRYLSLTPAGATAAQRLDEIAADVTGVVLAPLSGRERATLARLLRKASLDLAAERSGEA